MPSLYDISVPVLADSLKTVRGILRKGVDHAASHNITDAALLDARLAADMSPLPNQIMIMHAVVGIFAEKVAGRPTTTRFDKLLSPYEGTVDRLFDLIDDAVRDLEAIKRESVDGKEETEFTFNLGKQVRRANALDYVQKYSVPYKYNAVYFHLNITYAILRQMGAPLGKWDYIEVFQESFPDA
ncbi:hypothetical protein KJ359_008783 [Pestalotiopsis sp. 9143b]|nr:hypothetical protein KJ359_008783 [Pestalotiopsis sp. 9143b]